MARNAVAMPAAVWKKRRRLMPSRLAIRAPISLTRVSNSRCFFVCKLGMNSSLETDCTGIGDGNNDSAAESFSSSLVESMLMVPPRFGGRTGRALHSFWHIDGRPAKSARSQAAHRARIEESHNLPLPVRHALRILYRLRAFRRK